MQFSADQIEKLIAAYVRINAFTANGGSGNVTAALTTALSTASNSGGSVPLQQSTSNGVGVITGSPNNRVEIYDATSKEKLKDASDNEIYGRISFAASVYTLTYFKLVAGVETAHSFGANTSVDFEFAYIFNFNDFPVFGLIGVHARNVSNDPKITGTNNGIYEQEKLTVTALNTVSNLSHSPIAGKVKLTVRGQTLYVTENFSISGQGITFSAGQITNTGFNIKTTDVVFAEYFR